MKNASVKFGFKARKLYFGVTKPHASYKLQLSYENIWQVQFHRSFMLAYRAVPGKFLFSLHRIDQTSGGARILSLLCDPNPNSSANSEAASLFSENKREHVRSTRVETFPSTQNPVRIIPRPAGIVQAVKLLKQKDTLLDLDGAIMSTQEYIKKVVEDVGEDEDFKSGSWVSATDYVNANGGTMSGCLGDIKNFLKNGKLDQVVEIVKSCSPNVITVAMKDLAGTIHHKVIGEGGYGKDISV
ncbi:hypothetical protein Tco_0767094 [Tanacetum coccineum]